MASKSKNPYNKGSGYANIWDAISALNCIYTVPALLALGHKPASVTVVGSPRAEGSSTRDGDCRGNMSSQGHLYYMEKLKKVKGESQRFRRRFRKTPLEKRVRPPKKDVEAQKTTKAKAKVETPKAKVATPKTPATAATA